MAQVCSAIARTKFDALRRHVHYDLVGVRKLEQELAAVAAWKVRHDELAEASLLAHVRIDNDKLLRMHSVAEVRKGCLQVDAHVQIPAVPNSSGGHMETGDLGQRPLLEYVQQRVHQLVVGARQVRLHLLQLVPRDAESVPVRRLKLAQDEFCDAANGKGRSGAHIQQRARVSVLHMSSSS